MATIEECIGRQREYWSKVKESDGFDIEGIAAPAFGNPVQCFYYQDRSYFPDLCFVKGYATVGLERYNMLKGTSFVLHALVKVNITPSCVPSYYITLVGNDAVAPREFKTFQIRVDEEQFGTLKFTVSIARIKDEVTTKKPFVPHFDGGAVADDARFQGELPDWPSRDAFNDTNRFYVLKVSEWQAVKPYLELTVVANNRSIFSFMSVTDQVNILTNLQILRVVVETSEHVDDDKRKVETSEDVDDDKTSEDVDDDKLKAKSLLFFITFKGLDKDCRSIRVGEDVERHAIVRRVLDEKTGYMSFLGKLWNSRATTKKRKTLVPPRLCVFCTIVLFQSSGFAFGSCVKLNLLVSISFVSFCRNWKRLWDLYCLVS